MKPTKFTCQIFDELKAVANLNGFTKMEINAKLCFPYLNVFRAIVEANIEQLLRRIREIEEDNEDFYDAGDWDELHKEVLLSDNLLVDIQILQDLGTSNYADEAHYKNSLSVLLTNITSQLDAKNEGNPYEPYYLSRMIECVNEILELQKDA